MRLRPICPECGEPLRVMYIYPHVNGLVRLLHCNKCTSDWEEIYIEGRIERIQRYYFG